MSVHGRDEWMRLNIQQNRPKTLMDGGLPALPYTAFQVP